MSHPTNDIIFEDSFEELVERIVPIVEEHYQDLSIYYDDFESFINDLTEELKRDREARNNEK